MQLSPPRSYSKSARDLLNGLPSAPSSFAQDSLYGSSVKEKMQDFNADVFISGSGPIGATYALLLVKAGFKVIMCEMGAADSFKAPTVEDDDQGAFVPGAHKKNEIEYQKDIDRFVHVIQGALSTVSVPVKALQTDTLDPSSWGAEGCVTCPGDSDGLDQKLRVCVTNGKNPKQDPTVNLAAQAVTRGVGGMSTHWTCATPRIKLGLGLPEIIPDASKNAEEWARLYDMAEAMIGTTTSAYDHSIRHTLVLNTLLDAYREAEPVRDIRPLPLACTRMKNADYVYWHATDRLLEPIYKDAELKSRFKLLTNHRCTRLWIDGSQVPGGEWKIGAAELKDLLADVNCQNSDAHSYISAKMFVVAAGAVATPQILFNSGFGPKKEAVHFPTIQNLGKYITEQPMTFCQIILKKSLIASIPSNPYNLDWWAEKVKYQMEAHPEDPLKFPFRDGEPQAMQAPTIARPWHAQIHRDAFSYGAVAETIDTRTIVDFRFFGYTEPREENTLTFETEFEDGYGMPQPTFHFRMSDDDRERSHNMMTDMTEVASKLGGYLPGSAPQFMTPGLALHLAGTTRAGLDKETHVADTHCKVYDFANLYVGGNGVIPTGFAANPTLTSIAYAVRSVEDIVKKLQPGADFDAQKIVAATYPRRE